MRIALVSSEPVDYTIAFANGLAPHAEVVAFLPEGRYRPLSDRFDPRVALHLADWPRTRSLRNPLFLARLTRDIRRARPALVHVLSNTTLWLNAAVPFWHPLPVVTTVHDVERHPGDRETARLPDWAATLMARQSDHLVVMGERLRAAAMHRFGKSGERVHVVPHPAILRYAEEAWDRGLRRQGDPEEFRILMFGRIFAYKGLSTLLCAERLIGDRIRKLRVTIAGRGDDPLLRAHLMGRPERYEIHHGFVPDSLVAELFTQTDLVVLPYDEASQSGVLHVAAAFGKAVVATDVGELRRTVTGAGMGLVVPPADPCALAQAVERLAHDPAARMRHEAAALAWSLGPTAPGRIGEGASALYRRIVASAAGAALHQMDAPG